MGGHALGPLVLLVDDSLENRDIYAECLVDVGYRVETADCGLDALDKVAKALPDAILMDLSMPDMDGWEAILRLRADPTTRAIPVIVVSGHVGLDGRTPQEAGCVAYLSKPFHLDDLIGAVRDALGKRK